MLIIILGTFIILDFLFKILKIKMIKAFVEIVLSSEILYTPEIIFLLINNLFITKQKFIIKQYERSFSYNPNGHGIPDYKKRTLILDLMFNEKYFERVIHHEVFHLIQDSYPKIFNEEVWSNFNKKNFEYAECSTCTNKLGLDIYNNTNGFLTEYSKTIPSEDMAEVYSFIITDKENINKIKKIDPIIFNKVEFINSKLKEINNL